MGNDDCWHHSDLMYASGRLAAYAKILLEYTHTIYNIDRNKSVFSMIEYMLPK